MKSTFLRVAAPLLLAVLTAGVPSPSSPQHPLTQSDIMAMDAPRTKIPVPGNNKAIYGPVPKYEQIFDIEFLEIAPSPVPINQMFFVLLRGCIPGHNRKEYNITPDQLAAATLSITASGDLEDGTHTGPRTYIVPLRTTEFAPEEHIAIRNATGHHVDHLSLEGRNDILVDGCLPGFFVGTGNWTFDVVAGLGDRDRTCLFAVSLTQWLEGTPWW